jgi:hypothetical protein
MRTVARIARQGGSRLRRRLTRQMPHTRPSAPHGGYLPLILALHCFWRSPSLAPLPVVQVLLFQGNYRRRARELWRFAGQLRNRLICRGQLLSGSTRALFA